MTQAHPVLTEEFVQLRSQQRRIAAHLRRNLQDRPLRDEDVVDDIPVPHGYNVIEVEAALRAIADQRLQQYAADLDRAMWYEQEQLVAKVLERADVGRDWPTGARNRVINSLRGQAVQLDEDHDRDKQLFDAFLLLVMADQLATGQE